MKTLGDTAAKLLTNLKYSIVLHLLFLYTVNINQFWVKQDAICHEVSRDWRVERTGIPPPLTFFLLNILFLY